MLTAAAIHRTPGRSRSTRFDREALSVRGPRRAEKEARVLFLSSHCCSPLASASPGLDDTGAVVEWRQRAFAQARRVSQSATRYVTSGACAS